MTSITTKHVRFRCNICGTACETTEEEIDREIPSCSVCGSTVRFRSVIEVLSRELFGESLLLPDFPVRKNLRGIGMTDWHQHAMRLSEKFDYRNTFYHLQPRLDISAPSPDLEGTLDFIISSDVFEHVSPPIKVSFINLRKLLKPGGVVIFTGPNSKHFLTNITRDGSVQIFHDLVFHEGPGVALEMRLFAESSLLEEFRKACFDEVRIHGEDHPEHGISWRAPWSLPIAARTRSS